MENKKDFVLTAEMFAGMIRAAAYNLRTHASEINDLNVFPVPDGDTGDNMLSTLAGGAECARAEDLTLGEVAKRVSDGMLLSARGNSGVILSQFFRGIAEGLAGLNEADMRALGRAFRKGVKRAYSAVMKPTEGTILTVAKDATEFACNGTDASSVVSFLTDFADEARRSLDRTPELLPVLKDAGVVDSGGAGLLCIVEGMCIAFDGEYPIEEETPQEAHTATAEIDINGFTENDILTFGYCTELLVRLQRSKTDIESFDLDSFRDTLSSLGDSIVAVRAESVLKLHIHTMTPHKVFELCQQYGEFLKVKVENMSLQHNSLDEEVQAEVAEERNESTEPKKPYGVVVVASGAGIKQTFVECGADVIVEGGQSCNPSAEELLAAYRAANAETVFVFPNNGNVILAAKQAGNFCDDISVRVIETRNVGEGYAALSMADFSLDNADEVEAILYENMKGVLTGEIAMCVRDADIGEVSVKEGDYIGYVGKKILSHDTSRLEAAKRLADGLALDEHSLCLVFYGEDADEAECGEIASYIESKYPACEVYAIRGGQAIYSYIMVAE